MAPTYASPRILLADDDIACLRMLSRILSLHGYHVDEAEDGAAALELAHNTSYDLAILDYRMPGMNGVELFQKMREIQPQLVGIFLTGYPTIDTVFPAIHSGIERVLAKPVDSQQLLEVIEHFLVSD